MGIGNSYDDPEEKKQKQQGRAIALTSAPTVAGIIRIAGSLINTALSRATERTQRVIRWVWVWIYKQNPWHDSIARLKEVLGRNLFTVFHTDPYRNERPDGR